MSPLWAVAQPVDAIADPDNWLARWQNQYQSPEFSPLNRALVYPTITPNISQRSNSVKPSKTERELLAVWRKVFDDHFKAMPKELDPSQVQLLRQFQQHTDAAYDQLMDRAVNYAAANKMLMQAYDEFSAQSQALLEKLTQEKLKSTAQHPGASNQINPDFKRFNSSSSKGGGASNDQQSTELSDAQIKLKDSCKTEKIKLDQLMQEQQSWADVTSAVNAMLHDPYEREKARLGQEEQAAQRQSQIGHIQKFIDKNCHP
jgi:hypothetical protein